MSKAMSKAMSKTIRKAIIIEIAKDPLGCIKSDRHIAKDLTVSEAMRLMFGIYVCLAKAYEIRNARDAKIQEGNWRHH